MKIGIISDIHDSIPNLWKTIDILNKKEVKRVYFCGDVVSPFTLKFFQGLKAPVKAVFGNNEGDEKNILKRIKMYNLNFEYQDKQGRFFEDKLGNFTIGVFHGDIHPITNSLVKDDYYNLLFTGHTHLAHIKKLKSKIWINPGSVGGFSEEIEDKPTFATLDLKTKKAEIIHL